MDITGTTGTGTFNVNTGTTTNGGTIGGNLVVDAGATATNTGTVTGTTTNAGTITNNGTGVLTGNVDNQTGGTLNTDADGIVDTATLTNAGTVALSGDDTVAGYVSNGGTLSGAGTLTATTYDLNDGSSVSGNLGDGTVEADGTVDITGTTGTGTFNVNTGTTTNGGTIGGNLVVDAGATATNTGTVTGTTTNAGTITNNGTGVLTGNVDNQTGAQLNTDADGIADTATLTNAGTVALSGDDTVAGYVSNGGTLSGAGTLTATTYDLNDGSSVSGNLGDGTVEADGIVDITGTTGTGTFNVNTGTTTNAGTIGGNLVVDAGATATNTGTVTGTTTNAGTITNNGTGVLTGNVDNQTGGTLNTDADGIVDTATLTNAGTVALSGDDTVAGYVSNGGELSGAGTLTATTYDLNDGSSVSGNLGDGTVEADGTVDITGTTGTGTFNVNTGTTTNAGTIGGNLVVDAGATATNTGTVTGTTTNAGTITNNGTGVLTGNVDNQTGGTLNTDADGIVDTATLTNAGTVALSGDDTVAGYVSNGGELSGAGTLTATTYDLNDGSSVSGNLGDGTVEADGTVDITGTTGTGTFNVNTGTTTNAGTIGGNLVVDAGATATNTGTVTGTTTNAGTITNNGTGVLTGNVDNQTGGTLNTDADGIVDTATLTNAGTVALSGDDTVAGYVSNGGELSGAGTLTATTYDLNDGSSVSGNLGDGTVEADGTVDITGTTGAGTFNVNTGTTTNSGTIGGNLVVDAGATATNTGTVTGTTTNAGTITNNGTGVLTGNVDNQTGGTLNTDADGIADTATLTNAGTVALSGDDTVAGYVSNGGELSGAGTLTATTYDLNGGSSVSGNLGDGTVEADGTVDITGTTGTGTFNVNTGTTTNGGTIGGNLVVDAGATATNTGTVTGTTTNAGTITNSGTGVLTGNVDNQTGGTLNTDADGIVDTATLTNAGTVALSGDDTVAGYVSNGGTLSGAGTLTATTYDLNDGSSVSGNLGDGTVEADGTVGITGTTGTGTFNVNSGTTTNSGTIGSPTNVNGGVILNTTGTLMGTVTVQAAGMLNNNVGGTLGGHLNNLGNSVNDGVIMSSVSNSGDLANSGSIAGHLTNVGDVTFLGTTGSVGSLSSTAGSITGGGSGTEAAVGSVSITGPTDVNITLFDAGNQTSLEITGVNTADLSGATLALSDISGTEKLFALNTFQLIDLAPAGVITSGFGAFDAAGIDSDVRGFFDTSTGTFYIVQGSDPASDSSGAAKTTAIPTSASNDYNVGSVFLALTEDIFTTTTGSQFANLDASSGVGGDVLTRAFDNANASSTDGVTLITEMQELSPEVYGAATDYTFLTHKNYLEKAMHAPYSVHDGVWTVFGGMTNYDLETNASANDANYSLDSSGGYAGVSMDIEGVARAGIFVAADSGEITAERLQLDTDGQVVGLFAEKGFNFFGKSGLLTGTMSYSQFEYEGSRVAQGFINTVDSIDSGAFQIGADYAFTAFQNDQLQLRPSAGLNYYMVKTDSFEETGAFNNLSLEETTKNLLVFNAELDAIWTPVAKDWGVVATIGLESAVGAEDTKIDASFSGSPNSFDVYSPGIDGVSLNYGVSVFYNYTESASLELGYTGRYQDGAESVNGMSARVRISF